MNAKAKIAVHKFASCDGCQLAFLNLGEALLQLAQTVEILHFAEAGMSRADAICDIAFVEGSICTPADAERIRSIRANSGYLITIGACATSGGLQALRNMADGDAWMAAVYARPDYIASLAEVTPISEHVKVDFELWGCPVSGEQLLTLIKDLLHGVSPREDRDRVCLECKRQGTVCGLVSRGQPCMGPVTRNGCGALCPSFGRACYACYGPAERANTDALNVRFEGLGLLPEQIAARFQHIHVHSKEFAEAAKKVKP